MTHEWGLLIVVYLFLGGLSAGLLVLSSLASLLGGGRYVRVAAVGAWAAPWPVLVGTGLLVLDLGQPFYFWKLLVAVQPRSPMWLGTWLLTLFSLVSLSYASLFLTEASRLWKPKAIEVWKRRLALAGLPLGIGVGIYTGVLLGVLVARPLWNTPLVAQLFLVSALSTAAALLLLLIGRAGTERERHLLTLGDAALIVVELGVLAWMLVAARTSTAGAQAGAAMLTGGAYGWVFWTAVVLLGLLAPLAIESVELLSPRPAPLVKRLAAVAPLAVLAGGLMLRWVMVYAGQASGLAQ